MDWSNLVVRAALLVVVTTAAGGLASPTSMATGAEIPPPTWTLQRVAQATRADDFSLTRTFINVNSSERSTILYCDGPNQQGGFDLKLARGPLQDGSFTRRSVDPEDEQITGYASLAVDGRGNDLISYVSGVLLDKGVLKFAEGRGHRLSAEVVDPVPATVQTAIAVDANGHPLIAYTKSDNELLLASRTNAGWTTAPVVQAQIVALDLAVDNSGHPQIAYVAWDGSAYVLDLASFDGTTWTVQTVGHVASQGIEFGVDIVIGPNGNPQMVLPVLEPERGLAFAHHTSTGWELEPVASGDLWQPSADLDSAGNLHVVFYDATDGSLMYAKRVSRRWAVSTIADSPSQFVRIGRQPSIAMDAQDRAHISYYTGKATKSTTLWYGVSTPD